MRDIKTVVALGLLLAGACAPAQPGAEPGVPGGPGPVAPPAPAKEAPQRGGTLMVPGTEAPENVHPYTQASSSFFSRALGPVYETLVSFEYEREVGDRWDSDFKVVPWLAESWQQPDPKTYVFELRRGVKWHDGTDFTADDLVFAWNFLRDPKNAFIPRGALADVATIEKSGPSTAKITTKQPNPGFLELIARANEVVVIPKHVVERGDDLSKVAIGTGPYKLREFDRTKASVFVRSDSYWRPGLPYMDVVHVVHGLDDAARLAGAVTGKFDILSFPDRLQLDAFRAQKRDTLFGATINDKGPSILVKQDTAPFNDLRVRKALHLFLDRQELNQVATLGDGTINPPGVPALKKGWAVPEEELLKLPGYRQPKDQDASEARRLLAEAGYPSGFKTSLVYGTNSFPQRAVAEPIGAQYRKLGVDITIRPMPGPDQRRVLRAGDYEMVLELVADMRIANRQWDVLHSTGGSNKLGFQDPELDRLLELQRSSGDLNEQKRAVRTMQELLLEKLYIIPTIDSPVYQLWQPWLKNYNYSFGGSPLIGQDNVGWMWLDVAKMPADRR